MLVPLIASGAVHAVERVLGKKLPVSPLAAWGAVLRAARGAERIVIASRSKEKTEPVLAAARAQGVKAEFVGVELTDLASVKRAADEILAMDLTIDALINNAGIAGVQGITKDGFELAFGTNHVAHYLWTEKLLPLVKKSAQGRVVIVSSQGHYRASGIDWDAVRKTSATVTAFPEYCVSKLANVLHGKSLARRLAGTSVTTYSLHPGGVASDIWQRRLGGFTALVRRTVTSARQRFLRRVRREHAEGDRHALTAQLPR